MGQVFSNFGVAEFYYDSTALRMHVPMNGVVFTPQPVSGGDPASVTNGQTWYNPNLGLRVRHAGVTYTLATGSGSYTDENAMDAIAAFLVAGTNITLTHNDGADTLTIDATGGGAFDYGLAIVTANRYYMR